jgi:hypothetical protein
LNHHFDKRVKLIETSTEVSEVTLLADQSTDGLIVLLQLEILHGGTTSRLHFTGKRYDGEY